MANLLWCPVCGSERAGAKECPGDLRGHRPRAVRRAGRPVGMGLRLLSPPELYQEFIREMR